MSPSAAPTGGPTELEMFDYDYSPDDYLNPSGQCFRTRPSGADHPLCESGVAPPLSSEAEQELCRSEDMRNIFCRKRCWDFLCGPP